MIILADRTMTLPSLADRVLPMGHWLASTIIPHTVMDDMRGRPVK
jgi:hypothetical protein